MKWNELLEAIDAVDHGGKGNPDIGDVVYDSRQARNKTVYVAIAGYAADGDTFIADAVSRGATAVISRNPQPDCGVCWAQVNDPRAVLGILGRRLWHIDDTLRFVGITGTNGKTTCAYLTHALLQEVSRDPVWLYSTIRYKTGDTASAATRTTPESVDIFRMIGHAVYAPRSVVMEVSSHALYLRRVEGIGYQVAVWTNLSRDHLDFHQSMEAYYEAKKRLFTHYLHKDGVAVVNIDDAYGRRLVRDLSGIRVITYGTSVAADIKIAHVVCTTGHTQITVKTEKESFEVQAHMLGQFSAYNIAALFGVAAALEIDLHRVAALCGNGLYVPGRMERVGVDTPFTVLVDYAHSPDALDNVLATLAPITKGRLICVFGCGGDRDPGKRAPMAQAVARWCDEAVVTSDNPRTEHPRAIIEDILDGIPLDFPHLVIQDRKKAIYHAIEHARSGDCICIAGKGHEEYQEIGTQRIHFSDREVALDAIESCKTPVCQ